MSCAICPDSLSNVTSGFNPAPAARANEAIESHLIALARLGPGPDPRPAAALACSILAISAVFLADTTRAALARATATNALQAFMRGTPEPGLGAAAGQIAAHLATILSATAVRLPGRAFLASVPVLRALLERAIAERLIADPDLNVAFLVDISLRLARAVDAGQARAIAPTVGTLRQVLTAPIPAATRRVGLPARSPAGPGRSRAPATTTRTPDACDPPF